MALKEFKRIELIDTKLNKFQENVSEFVSQINPILLSGNLLLKTIGDNPQEITIATTRTLVSHGLGRSYQGFIIVDRTGNATVWRDTTYTENKDKFIPLIASSSVTVKLWVF